MSYQYLNGNHNMTSDEFFRHDGLHNTSNLYEGMVGNMAYANANCCNNGGLADMRLTQNFAGYCNPLLSGAFITPEYLNEPYFYNSQSMGYLQDPCNPLDQDNLDKQEKQYNLNLMRDIRINDELYNKNKCKCKDLENFGEHMTAEDAFRLSLSQMHNEKSEADNRYERMNACGTAQCKTRCCNKLNPQYDLSSWGKIQLSDDIGSKELAPSFDRLEFNLLNRLNLGWQKQPRSNTECSYNQLMYHSNIPNFMSDKLMDYC